MIAEYDDFRKQVSWKHGKRNISRKDGYSCALLRNVGHTSASACVHMLCVGDHRGSFTSKRIVTAYEHRACRAQKVLSRADYANMAEIVSQQPLEYSDLVLVEAGKAPVRQTGEYVNLQVAQYRGDATTTEAIQEDKVYLADCHSSAASFLALRELARSGAVHSCIDIAFNRDCCDMQRIVHGNGNETFCLMKNS